MLKPHVWQKTYSGETLLENCFLFSATVSKYLYFNRTSLLTRTFIFYFFCQIALPETHAQRWCWDNIRNKSNSASHYNNLSAAAGNILHSAILSHRPDVHEMDHAGILDSELNRYLCCSALWSLLMTSRWPSSIFKTLSVHKGSSGNEVLVTSINEISLCRQEWGSRQGSRLGSLTYCMWSNSGNTSGQRQWFTTPDKLFTH